MAPQRSSNSRLLIGFLLVLIGCYLLLNNFDLVPFRLPPYFFSWQMILIILGLIIMGTRENKGGGVTLVLIGVIFLIPEVFDVSFNEILQFWPLIFVIIGLGILLRYNKEKKITNYSARVLEADYIDDAAVFASNRRTVNTNFFKGGRVTAIIGGSRIDLTQAALAEGKYEIDVFVLLGSVEIIVPNDWNVRNDVNAIAGDFKDKRTYHTPYHAQADRQLFLKGITILGNGEIKSP